MINSSDDQQQQCTHHHTDDQVVDLQAMNPHLSGNQVDRDVDLRDVLDAHIHVVHAIVR